jgi:hypothetical protein
MQILLPSNKMNLPLSGLKENIEAKTANLAEIKEEL